MKLKAFAKINLNLHVLPPKNKAGFYEIKFINCQAELSDEIILRKQRKKIEIICNNKNVPKNKQNFCWQAADLLKKKVNKKDLGVKIIIKKNIPVKSGLGGGSSNAAMTLKGLNKLWNLNLNKKQLLSIAKKIGMDVQYCLIGGLCLIKGRRGEIIELLNYPVPRMWLVIIFPREKKPSTAWAYKNLNQEKIGKKTDRLEKLIKAVKQKDAPLIAENLHNDFETLTNQKYKNVLRIKKELLKNHALNAILAGAGLGIIGFFKTQSQALNAFNNLKLKYKKILLTQTL